MTLANLVATGQLKEHKTDRAQIQRLLETVGTLLKDAQVDGVSATTRFDPRTTRSSRPPLPR